MRDPEGQAADELARRRALHATGLWRGGALARRRAYGRALDDQDAAGGFGAEEPAGEPAPNFSWVDILAMIIAAYQVLLPVVLLFIGAVAAVYFLFRIAFVR